MPHSGRARLLTRVTRHDATSIVATAVIGDSYPLVQNGMAPALVGLEIGAQAAAALQALQGRASGLGAVVRGRVVRIHEAVFHCEELPVGTPLEITSVIERAVSPLAICHMTLRLDGVECVVARLSTHSDSGAGSRP